MCSSKHLDGTRSGPGLDVNSILIVFLELLSRLQTFHDKNKDLNGGLLFVFCIDLLSETEQYVSDIIQPVM